jgi:hypothetical protein
MSHTTIAVQPDLHEELYERKGPGQTYDEYIRKLLDESEPKRAAPRK